MDGNKGKIGLQDDEYAKLLRRKLALAQEGLDLFEKELIRMNVVPEIVLTKESYNSPVTRKANKRKAAEDADADAPRKRNYVGQRVARYFGKKLYRGTISSWDPAAVVEDGVDLWKVEYEDGDGEDYEELEVNEGLKLYEQEEKKQYEQEEKKKRGKSATR